MLRWEQACLRLVAWKLGEANELQGLQPQPDTGTRRGEAFSKLVSPEATPSPSNPRLEFYQSRCLPRCVASRDTGYDINRCGRRCGSEVNLIHFPNTGSYSRPILPPNNAVITAQCPVRQSLFVFEKGIFDLCLVVPVICVRRSPRPNPCHLLIDVVPPQMFTAIRIRGEAQHWFCVAVDTAAADPYCR